MTQLMRKGAAALMAFVLALCLVPVMAWSSSVAHAATTSQETVKIAGANDVVRAREVLEIVNKERTEIGLDPLVLDDELTKAAMQRAAELTIYYGHERPDGTDCFTAFPSGLFSAGENIAIGYSTAEAVMQGWFYDERELYNEGVRDSRVGHYLNIINPDFKSIGIGCFTQGFFCWEQAFSGSASTNEYKGESANAVYDVTIDYDFCGADQDFNMNDDLDYYNPLEVGETYELSYDITNDAWDYNYASLDPASASWTTSDASVCSVSDKGVVEATGMGKATITATLPSGKSLSYEWEVTEPSQIMYRLYNPNSGEHFYTASVEERDHLDSVGWDYEGIGWVAPVESSAPVYRLYSGTDHHYTTSTVERDSLINAGWSDEGIGWYSDTQQRVALLRQFNPFVDPGAPTNNSGSHNYTTSSAERDHLVSVGWNDEGIGWYAIKAGA